MDGEMCARKNSAVAFIPDHPILAVRACEYLPLKNNNLATCLPPCICYLLSGAR